MEILNFIDNKICAMISEQLRAVARKHTAVGICSGIIALEIVKICNFAVDSMKFQGKNSIIELNIVHKRYGIRMDRRDFEMKRIQKLLLCLALAVAMLPKTASAAAGNEGVPVEETPAAWEDNALEAEVVADQMKEYYLNETEPQGNTFYAYDVSSMALPEEDEEDSVLLELPLYRQGHNFTCGVSCVASVLRYAGYDFDAREDRLFWGLGATPEDGTNYLKIAAYLEAVRREGFPNAPVFATEIVCTDYALDESDLARTDRLLAQFRAGLEDGTPVICAIQAWRDDGDYTAGTEDDGHYVVLIGYKKDAECDSYTYYFMDPSTSGSYTYLTEEEFILRWHDNLDGNPTRLAIAVSYLNPEQGAPIHTAYHLD